MNNDMLLINRAKSYMEKLAEGIDHFTDAPVTAGTFDNEKMRRCFSYVSGILAQIIDKGGVAALSEQSASHVKPLLPFELPPEKRQKIYLSTHPADASTFTKNINRYASGSMRKTSGYAIGTWLLNSGFLEKDGNTRKPTAKGAAAGITVHIKQTPQLMYSYEAQQILLSNIDEIIRISNGIN
ncbi:MAG: hypothetical protein LBS19_01840 [Clostridiales bacterium]|jgi:hypothetical protein|nr:hypothetical protein [Clostridiales bacterium]